MDFTLRKQWISFFGIVLGSLLIAIGPGRHLLKFAYETGDQSYILLVPALSAMLVYRDSRSIFAKISTGLVPPAITAFGVGAVLIAIAYFLPAGNEIQMVATALGLIAFWVGAFMYAFGPESARAALFPLGMLLWIIPIPSVPLESFRYFLQVGSTELTDKLFQVSGVPYLRDGFVFHLPTQSIEVAKECSGIRSSLCLILLTLVVAHEWLRGNVRRALLLVSTVAIVILKNGVRIVSLTLLAIYVDPSFLTGPLHHQGGIVFFILGLVMLVPVLALLRRGDDQGVAPEPRLSGAPAGQ